MINRSNLEAACQELGFDRLAALPAGDIPPLLARWKADVEKRGGQGSLSVDPRQQQPWCRSVLLLSYPYFLFSQYPEDCAQISGYYFASQRAHAASGQLALRLQSLGIRAERAGLPIKPLAAACGLGTYGRNGVIVREEGLILLQAIAVDAPLDAPPLPPAFSSCGCMAGCESRAQCEALCPMGALRHGEVDVSRCLRNHMMRGTPLPDFLRNQMGMRLIGCDECTRPHNRKNVELPADYQELFHLEALLDPSSLNAHLPRIAQYLGENYANRNRLLAQAILAAANSPVPGRYRRHFEILKDHASPAVAQHALWALAAKQRTP